MLRQAAAPGGEAKILPQVTDKISPTRIIRRYFRSIYCKYTASIDFWEKSLRPLRAAAHPTWEKLVKASGALI